MPVLDDIAAERQRLAERLARVDAERQKLADQLAELDAADRVLSRFTPTKTVTPRRGRRAQGAEGTEPAAAPARRGRGGGGRGKAKAKPSIGLGDATLRSIALGNDVRPSRFGSTLPGSSGCRCGPITSAWLCSVTAVPVASVSKMPAGQRRRRSEGGERRTDLVAPSFGTEPSGYRKRT